MKATKKILAAFLVVMLLAVMATTAFAAGNGSITINGVKEGKTFDLYKVFDASGSGTTVAYTLNPAWHDFFVGTGAPGAGYLSTAAIDGVPTIVIDGTSYYLNITNSNVADFATAAFTWAVDNATADATATATAADETAGSMTVDSLDLGYWLVHPQGASNINGTNGSICSLTTAAPDATVNIKADYPEDPFDKTTTAPASVQTGAEVPYEITGKVPDTTGYTKYIYKVRDTMSNGLDFTEADLAAMTVTIDGTAITLPTLTNGAGTIADGNGNGMAKVSLEYVSTTTGHGFILIFDMTEFQDKIDADIKINYSAWVNENAANGTDPITNEALLNYSHDPSDEEDLTPDDPTPPVVVQSTNSIAVDKQDGENNNAPQAGAKFKLRKADPNNAGSYLYYKFVAADPTAGTKAQVTWVAEDQADELTTAVDTTTNKAIVRFGGLEDGTYEIVETEAPTGYNLAAPISVTVTHTTDADGNPVGVDHVESVVNRAGNTLPDTGGIGTTIFYIVGAALLLSAAVLLITRRRMMQED